MQPLRILVVDDNADIVDNLFEYFEPIGHIVDAASDGPSGMHLALTNEYDVIVMDIMLPGMDGTEVCRRLRFDEGIAVPVILLTARDGIEDKVHGFDCGADDYVTKPFAMPELEARMQAVVRRTYNHLGHAQRLQVADLVYDLRTVTVTRGGQTLLLNPACRRILEILMRAFPEVVPRSRIETALWGDAPPDSDTLRVHIYTLRTAIDKPFERKLLHTVHRMGYCLSTEERDA